MKEFAKNIVLFLIFGTIYFLLECLWKGHLSHWSMFVLAGIIGIAIGDLNEFIPWEMAFWKQCLIGMIISTTSEAITGWIINLSFGLNVWHYEVLAFFYGQCSLIFSAFWFILSGVCILLDDWIRWKFFGEEKPHYKLK